MSKLRVLEVIRQGQIGGGESHLLDLISFLDKDRYEPVCLAFTDGEMVRRLTQMGVVCHVIETQKPFDVKVQRQIRELMRKEHVRLVHAHGSRAASNVLLPARQLRLPLVYTVHGWSFHDDQSWLVKKLRGWSEKLICHYASQVICVSQSNKDTGREVFGLKSAVVIDNGVNLQRFCPDLTGTLLRANFHFDGTHFVVGFIARCTKQKNPLGFLRAIELAHSKNPAVRGLFVGEGEMDGEVDDYLEQHQMHGYVYRSPFRTDVPDLLRILDVYCLPSLWEGLSIALLEAMAMRKPVIVTPTDGTIELVRHEENGLIVPFDNPQAIADAIGRYCQDASLREHCAAAARTFVEQHYNAERVAYAVAQEYDKLEKNIIR